MIKAIVVQWCGGCESPQVNLPDVDACTCSCSMCHKSLFNSTNWSWVGKGTVVGKGINAVCNACLFHMDEVRGAYGEDCYDH